MPQTGKLTETTSRDSTCNDTVFETTQTKYECRSPQGNCAQKLSFDARSDLTGSCALV